MPLASQISGSALLALLGALAPVMRYPPACLAFAAALMMSPIAHAGTSSFVVLIGNGPFSGTYRLPAAEVSCFHSAKRRVYSSGWKDFSPANAKSIAEAGVEVQNPDAPGPKFGTVLVTFGDSDKTATHYAIYHEPLTMTNAGALREIMLRAKTKDGVQIQVTLSCMDTMEID
jgi:hypothetical protein